MLAEYLVQIIALHNSGIWRVTAKDAGGICDVNGLGRKHA